MSPRLTQERRHVLNVNEIACVITMSRSVGELQGRGSWAGVAGDIINQAGSHGGSRQGAGRPLGARDRKTLRGQADMAALMARIEPAQLLLLSPVDVLRLAMLLALRRGDLAVATEHARRLLPSWEPRMGLEVVEGKVGGSRGAAVVSRLVEALHPVAVSEKPPDPASVPRSRRRRDKATAGYGRGVVKV